MRSFLSSRPFLWAAFWAVSSLSLLPAVSTVLFNAPSISLFYFLNGHTVKSPVLEGVCRSVNPNAQVGPCDHHQEDAGRLCHPRCPLPRATPLGSCPLHPGVILPRCSSLSDRLAYTWNPIACSLLRLASFTRHDTFKPIQRFHAFLFWPTSSVSLCGYPTVRSLPGLLKDILAAPGCGCRAQSFRKRSHMVLCGRGCHFSRVPIPERNCLVLGGVSV